MKINKLVAGLFLLFTALMIAGCGRSPEALEIGSPAPRFQLPDMNGREITLEQYKGKVILLDFWATWCGPCRMTMPVLEKLQREYPNDLVLLAVNLQESKQAVSEYMQQQNVDSHVLLDESGSVGETYGTGAIPMQVLIDKAGVVRDIQVGYNPRMASQLRTKIENLR